MTGIPRPPVIPALPSDNTFMAGKGQPAKEVGGYRMGLGEKPSAWHRWWVRFTLGWVWEDRP